MNEYTNKEDPDKRDIARAKKIARDISLSVSTAGDIREENSKRDRKIQAQAFTHGTSSDNGKDEDLKKDPVAWALKQIIYQSAFANLTPPNGPVATIQNPIAIKDAHGKVMYLDNGVSCRFAFNTSSNTPSAVLAPEKDNTFDLPAPVVTGQKPSRTSFAETTSPTAYAQIGPISAIPSRAVADAGHIKGSFEAGARKNSFHDAFTADTPIVAPGLIPNITTGRDSFYTSDHSILKVPAPPAPLFH